MERFDIALNTKDNIRNATVIDLQNKLNKFGRCCMMRCPGFGKTWALSDLVRFYDKVLYVYPSDVIKDTAYERILQKQLGDRVTFKSYSYLALHADDCYLLNPFCDFDLVIFDECHHMGGERVQKAIAYIMNNSENIHFVGATATIERMDNFDVVYEFFSNVTTFPYTIHDAIQDGFITKPIYYYCVYQALDKAGRLKAIEKDLLEKAVDYDLDVKDELVQSVVKSSAMEIANIFNLPNIIRDACKKEGYNDFYMKFIVFFSHIQHLNGKLTDVISWFQEAFPNKIIDVLIIDSEDKYKSNVHKINSFNKSSNRISLILCVDMLNEGYHIENLTGVVLYRVTNSASLYTQQVGRGLNSGLDKPCLIFDVVDNLHREMIYNTRSDFKASPISTQTNEHPVTAEIPMNTDGKIVGKYAIAPINLEKLSEEARKELEELINLPDADKFWYKSAVSQLTQLDLVAEVSLATYEELISRIGVEPLVTRFIRTILLHFKRWCMNNNIDYPIKKKELTKVILNNSNALEAFKNYMDTIIKTNNLQYPFRDAKKLLAFDGILNLDIYARIYRVAVPDLVKAMAK